MRRRVAHSIEIRTPPSSTSSTCRIGPFIPAAIASRIRSDIASEIPGTWLMAARGTRDQISSLLRGVPTRAPRWSLGVGDAVVVAIVRKV